MFLQGALGQKRWLTVTGDVAWDSSSADMGVSRPGLTSSGGRPPTWAGHAVSPASGVACQRRPLPSAHWCVWTCTCCINNGTWEKTKHTQESEAITWEVLWVPRPDSKWPPPPDPVRSRGTIRNYGGWGTSFSWSCPTRRGKFGRIPGLTHRMPWVHSQSQF